MLFPVDFETLRDSECFDADSGKDLAVELSEYFIPAFSHQSHREELALAALALPFALQARLGEDDEQLIVIADRRLDLLVQPLAARVREKK